MFLSPRADAIQTGDCWLEEGQDSEHSRWSTTDSRAYAEYWLSEEVFPIAQVPDVRYFKSHVGQAIGVLKSSLFRALYLAGELPKRSRM